MSVILNLHEKTRSYKIDVFGLQDNFISVLQSYQDNFIGQVVEPLMEIKDDGTQTFVCKIPKFYLDEIHNTKILNPRWQDVKNGILAENTRVLKVTIQFDEEEPKVFPFIIDKITNKRDKDFSVYKEVSCNGLAFSELGKTGYKLELNKFILEQDFEKNPDVIPSINYWLDYVFPNEKDENGKITKWLTPWCYEIRMDWRGHLEELSNLWIDGGKAGQLEGYDFYDSRNADYTDEEKIKEWLNINAGTSDLLYKLRDETKIYENPYISNWAVINGKLQPISVEPFIEKARYIDCKNSNKYNITQTIAETFEVFCSYEYKCTAGGHFVKSYYDDYGNIWTGKKVIFFNRAIKTDNPLVINYQHNLQSISRVADSSQVYTKMYVNPIQSEVLDNGYVSIADTSLNPLLDEFILNFDYLYQVGSITDLQKKEVDIYSVQTHQINSSLIAIDKLYNDLVVEINNLEADKSKAEDAVNSAQEQLVHYEKLRDAEVTNTPIIKDKTNSYSMWLVPLKNDTKLLKGSFELKGVNQNSIVGYGNYEKKTPLFPSINNPLIFVQSVQDIDMSNKNNWYVINDEDGFPLEIYTSQENPSLLPKKNGGNSSTFFNKEVDGSTGVLIYFELEYLPKNKYIAICQRFLNIISTQSAKIVEIEEILGQNEDKNWENWTGKRKELRFLEEQRNKLLDKKSQINLRFERIMGPALREGYWIPNNYEDPGQGYNKLISKLKPNLNKEISFIFDNELFEGEEIGYYYGSKDDYHDNKKTHYSYIRLDVPHEQNKNNLIYQQIGLNNKTDDFSIILQKTKFIWILQQDNDLLSNQNYYILLDGKYYNFKTNIQQFLKNDKVELFTNTNNLPKIQVTRNSTTIFETQCALLEAPPTHDEDFSYISATRNFEGLTNNLGTRHLYNKAGFIYSFIQDENGKIVPVALLNNKDIDYNYYDKISYSFDKNQTIFQSSPEHFLIYNDLEDFKIVYPRIKITIDNVNKKSDLLKLSVTQNGLQLTKYEDFTILQRKKITYLTLKVTNNNLLNYIMLEPYNIIFQASKANEKLYLDAKRIAKDNSKPKYSYQIVKANLPQEINFLELGQLTYINDYSIDAHKEYGYVSGIKYQLDQPSKDQVTVSNYKTKFEDLFSSITAQNEAMKQNQKSYSIAAQAFTSSGEVQKDILQTTLDNNNFAFNFSSTNMTIDDAGGLVLTNTENYSNGVYGQVALRGGGIFCSNSLTQSGEREWTTGITPDGINASAITTGKLDTNLIRIFSGDSLAFQWNSEGLYAFKELQQNNNNGNFSLDETNYIRLNKEGLLYINDGIPQLELGWKGLTLSSAGGHVQLTSENGLEIFDEERKLMAQLGKIAENKYGIIFKNKAGNITLKTDNDGNLELQNTLLIGNSQHDNNYAGLCGNDDYQDTILKEYIRIWAGSKTPTQAEFVVSENGTVKTPKLVIPENGRIVFKKNGYDDIVLTYDSLSELLQK